MLRTVVTRTTAAVTAQRLTVTHGLGVTLDFWAITPRNARSRAPGRPVAYYPTANVIFVCDFINTRVTLNVTCVAYQGRLY
jgi:hypothetical protein